MSGHRLQSGFSLVELITVVVLLGLLAAGSGMLILNPIEAYDDMVRRQQLVDQGEMALRQIARDVRRALPNSIRLTAAGTGVAVELVPSIDGARYRDEVGGEFVAAFDTLEFSGADTDFNLLGSFNVLGTGALGGTRRLVIYNTAATPSDGIYADAAANANPGIVTTAATAVTLSLNTPASQDPEIHINMNPAFGFSQQSPGQRVFVIDEPISYVCNPASGQIVRHSGYGFNASQPAAPGGSSATVISRLSGCNMSYSAGTSQRGGILSIEITISDGGESVALLHQVHVANVP